MRKPLRLARFDYSLDGAYFITACTYRRRPLLNGEIAAIVEAELFATQQRFRVTLDDHVIMSDHLHAILFLPGGGPSLGQVVGAAKSLAAVEVRRRGLFAGRLWQPRFFDHVVRDDRDLSRVREYIRANPTAKALKDGHFEALQKWLDAQYGG